MAEVGFTDQQLTLALKIADRTVGKTDATRVSCDRTGCAMICPLCEVPTEVLAHWTGPAAGRMQAMKVAYATHWLLMHEHEKFAWRAGDLTPPGE